ncbi:porin [Buchnera aphidicola]|uniref:porin n=1 Tax=Buchnera aphidicola TaxID=9 RepID=UPI0031B80ABC
MIKINNFLIMIFVIFFSINSAHALTIYKSENIKIYGDATFTQYKKNTCNIDKKDSDYKNYNNLLNLMLYGIKQNGSDIFSYFKCGLQVKKEDTISKYSKIQVKYINPLVIGIYVNKIGLLEIGKDHNFMYEINKMSRGNVKNDHSDILFKQQKYLNSDVENSITYHNVNFFGLIDNLTVASQYQYSSHDNKITNDIISQFIKYDFKNTGFSLSGVYLTNINHYIHPVLYNLSQYKNESYSLSGQYVGHHLNISSCYNNIYRIDPINSIGCSFYNYKSFNIYTEYKVSSHIFTDISYSNIYHEYDFYNKNDIVSRDFILLQKYKRYYQLEQIYASVKYYFNKNIFIYIGNSFNILYNHIDHSYNKKNILKSGIVYNF